MEKRIALEKRGRPDDQIVELILDNCRSTAIDGLTDNFKALEVLSLINVGLVSLKSFPKLPSLRKLELSDNRISNGLCHLTGSPKLTNLNLSGNRIKDLSELEPLKELGELEMLDLFNNAVTSVDEYRKKIFDMIPSLKYLDGFDRNDKEVPSDGELGEEESLDDDDDSSRSSYSYSYDENVSYDDEDVSLADVYNDNLEDDNQDWIEEGGEYADELTTDDDEEEESEEAPADKSQAEAEADGETEESEARGTKRKHDGTDG